MAKREPERSKRVDKWTTIETKALHPHEKALEKELPTAEPAINKAIKNHTGRFMWPEN